MPDGRRAIRADGWVRRGASTDAFLRAGAPAPLVAAAKFPARASAALVEVAVEDVVLATLLETESCHLRSSDGDRGET